MRIERQPENRAGLFIKSEDGAPRNSIRELRFRRTRIMQRTVLLRKLLRIRLERIDQFTDAGPKDVNIASELSDALFNLPMRPYVPPAVGRRGSSARAVRIYAFDLRSLRRSL